MKLAINNRLQKLEVSRRGVPMEAAIIEPMPGETNQEAQARHMAAHLEQAGAPTIYLRLAKGEPCEAN